MKKIEIEDIDFNIKYEGYLWKSDSKVPVIFQDEQVDKALFAKLPFIVEGHLFAKEDELSLKIKNIDGDYHIYAANLKSLPSTQLSENSFVAMKNSDGIKHIQSVQFWEQTADELCENMPVLEPSWVAFKGFK